MTFKWRGDKTLTVFEEHGGLVIEIKRPNTLYKEGYSKEQVILDSLERKALRAIL